MNRGRVTAASGMLLLALVMSGCAGVAGQPDTPAPTGPATSLDTSSVDCLAPDLTGWGDASHADAQVAIRIPADFEPVAASTCDYWRQVEDEDGLWSGATLERRVGDFTALKKALSAPDVVPEAEQACDASVEVVRPLWLHDAHGVTIRVDWPKDACNKTTADARDALAQLPVEESTFSPVRLVETRAALDAGCSTNWGPPADKLVSPSNPAESPDRAWMEALDSAESVQVCRFEIDAETGTGHFVSAHTFDQSQSTAFTVAIASAADAPTCNESVGAFVVVTPRTGATAVGSVFTVELDGCRRIVSPDARFSYAAPAELLALLELS